MIDRKHKVIEFFSILYGDDYPGTLAIWNKATKLTKFFNCDQSDDLAEYVLHESENEDVYFGVGLLNEAPSKGRGKYQDVMAIPCFWLDVDINSDAKVDKKYPLDVDEAKNILNEFPLKPSMIISTGRGMHCYWLLNNLWVLSNDKERKKAADMASAFQKCINHLFNNYNYKLDNTADLTRVLRIPGTFNYKGEAPIKVKFLNKKNYEKRYYTIQQINDAIKEVMGNSLQMPKEYTSMRKESLAADDFPQSKVSNIIKGCNWMKHCFTESRNLSEPEWFFMLTVVAFCKNPLEWAYKVSQNYNEYSEKETRKKLKRIQREHRSPVSCHYIKENFPGHCNNCDKNVQTPFTLGIKNDSDSLEKIGFIFDEDGWPKSINGNIFARYILTRKELIFTPSGYFYVYQDGVWKRLDHNELSRMLRNLVHEFIPDFWTKRLESIYFEPLTRATPYVKEINCYHDYINLTNGMLDLQSFKLSPHVPDLLSTVRIPIEFNASAKCPKFDAFLNDIFESDGDIINVIEEIFGYCLTADVSAQKSFFFYGKGANGKSLLAEILMNLVGKPNTTAISLADLENSFSRYELVGKLLNLSTENEISSSGLNTTAFKAIVVGDPIQVEKKFEQGFMYQPFCKMLFLLNNLPYTRDRSWGFHRKILIIPFNKTYQEDNPNTRNYEEFKQELLSEMSGILNRALDGLKRLQQNKFRFSKSQAIEKLLDEYKQILNPYLQFVEETIEQGVQADNIANNVMISVFKDWCEHNGHDRLSRTGTIRIHNEIRDAIKESNLKFEIGEGRISGGDTANGGQRYICGVRLKTHNNQRRRVYQDDDDEIGDFD